MSVSPALPRQVSAWLTRFSVGTARALTPISGVGNTNYFLSTTDGGFVLTLYERVPAGPALLPQFHGFSLARSGVAVPTPIMIVLARCFYSQWPPGA